jgi:hypothetical protein
MRGQRRGLKVNPMCLSDYFEQACLPTAGQRVMNSLKGQQRDTYVALERIRHTDHGIA